MNRQQRRAYKITHKEEIERANENKKAFEVQVRYWNLGKWFFMISPHKSLFGFHANMDLGQAKEYFALNFFFKSYSIGKIK